MQKIFLKLVDAVERCGILPLLKYGGFVVEDLGKTLFLLM